MQAAELNGEHASGRRGQNDQTGIGPVQTVTRFDLYRGFCAAPLWMLLGWSDIRLRYRRSVLGPFWITLSMSVLIIVLGLVYSRIFHTDIRPYLPYLALGFIV